LQADLCKVRYIRWKLRTAGSDLLPSRPTAGTASLRCLSQAVGGVDAHRPEQNPLPAFPETRVAGGGDARPPKNLGVRRRSHCSIIGTCLTNAELRQVIVSLRLTDGDASGAAADTLGPLNATLLYVGGRPTQIGHLRALSERSGGIFLHHDGGIEERGGLLPGLVSRADAVLFPVDSVSHAAISLVKRLCRQSGKPLVPLRSTGLAPFCAALQNPALRTASNLCALACRRFRRRCASPR
jgi:hypothetical protein